MNFEKYLVEQLHKHPSSGPQDIVKQCYQAAYGAEHLLSDVARARKYLEQEYEAIDVIMDVTRGQTEETPLYEMISENVARVNLAAWKKQNLLLDDLFEMFVSSATVSENGRELLLSYLKIADKVIKEHTQIPLEEWTRFLEEYKEAGMPSIHHSQAYRENEHPAYRIVSTKYLC